MSASTPSTNTKNILWLKVCTLAGLQFAISLTWLIYNAYLPKLLTQFGFPTSLAATLLIIDSALAIILEPIMGSLSDRSQKWVGSRFPLISSGVIITSTLLIAIPCIVTFIPPTQVFKAILPISLVAWAIAMTIFRSPAIALLAKYSTVSDLPLAASVITLAGGLVAAFRPIANQYILSLGPIFAFSLASFVLLAAVFALRKVTPPDIPTVETNNPQIPIIKLALIFTMGFSLAWSSRLLMDAIGKLWKTQLNADVSMLMVGIGLFLAVFSLPAGWIATKFGNYRVIFWGLGFTLLGMILMLYNNTISLIIFIITIPSFSCIVNGIIPLIIELTPSRWIGLGIGTYFGGFSLAMTVFGLVFSQPQNVTPVIGLQIGTINFMIAGGCIFLTQLNKLEIRDG
jgi:MFS family permease